MRYLDNLLEIEKNEALYSYTFSFKNILMYPFIRFQLLQGAIEDMNKIPDLYAPEKISLIKKIIYFLKCYKYRPINIPETDIIFFGSDVSNIKKGDSYFNRLTESFANEYKSKTILIEASFKTDFKRPRTYKHVFANNIFNINAAIKYKLRKNNNKIDLLNIYAFFDYLKDIFCYKFTNNMWENIINSLIIFSNKFQYLYEEYIKYFRKIAPKIIFIEDAFFGGDKIPVIIAAKDLNIPVAEYQHGFISFSHPAYNYFTDIPESFKYYFPDYFLSYGEYWIKNSRIPIKTFKIGNPYISDTISQLKVQAKKEQILYISATIDPEGYVEDIIWLNNNIKNSEYSILFRIHPSETSRLQTFYKPIIDLGIQIDSQPLYNTLETVKYIIGDISTVLFEATLFNCIIFIFNKSINKNNIDINYFNSVNTIEEFLNNIISKNYKETDASYFWEENWRKNYRKLIDSIIKDKEL